MGGGFLFIPPNLILMSSLFSKASAPDSLDGLPRGKQTRGKPQALGHTTFGNEPNDNSKLRRPRRHTGASYMYQGVATTPTIAAPSWPSGRNTSEDKQNTWLQKELAKDDTGSEGLGPTSGQIPDPSTLHCRYQPYQWYHNQQQELSCRHTVARLRTEYLRSQATA